MNSSNLTHLENLIIDPTNGWWSPFTVTGYAEAYYDVDFNKPPDNRKPLFLAE
jgi:hypothetical protein